MSLETLPILNPVMYILVHNLNIRKTRKIQLYETSVHDTEDFFTFAYKNEWFRRKMLTKAATAVCIL
jgi:hypothetical protein